MNDHTMCIRRAFYSAQFQITDFSRFSHGFINCLASESCVVYFPCETENLREEVLRFLSNRLSAV